jgi:MoxR-like ATPase
MEAPVASSTDSSTRLAPEAFAERAQAIEREVGRVIVGQRELVRQTLTGLLANSHVLLEGVPGLGKTMLVRTIADVIDCSFNRIQFTPDLMPADITGTNILVEEGGQRVFKFQPGPIFANLVLADEINRATPKTQSSLLEAMQEHQVTVARQRYKLDPPFFVLATQNPLEMEGTYPLPEAQLDRFLMRLPIGYPSRDAEVAILDTHGSGTGHLRVDSLEPVASAADVAAAADAVTMVHVAPAIQHYIVDLADATRRHHDLVLGVSPRGALALQRAARAYAASSGRDYVIPDDVKALAPSILEHRIITTPEAGLRGVRGVDVIRSVVDLVRVPGATG